MHGAAQTIPLAFLVNLHKPAPCNLSIRDKNANRHLSNPEGCIKILPERKRERLSSILLRCRMKRTGG